MPREHESGSVPPPTASEREDRWQYDSFFVRIWHAPSVARFHRVEVQHLQTGLVSAMNDEASEWIAAVINSCLEGDPDPRALGSSERAM